MKFSMGVIFALGLSQALSNTSYAMKVPPANGITPTDRDTLPRESHRCQTQLTDNRGRHSLVEGEYALLSENLPESIDYSLVGLLRGVCVLRCETGLDHVSGVGDDGGSDTAATSRQHRVEDREPTLIIHEHKFEFVEGSELDRRVGEETDTGDAVT